MPYSRLDAEQITQTIDQLVLRVKERFGSSSLAAFLEEMSLQAHTICDDIRKLERPDYISRFVLCTFIGAILALCYFVFKDIRFQGLHEEAFSLMQGLDATLNVVILSGIGLLFIVRHENRQREKKALQVLHKLRSMAHIIDMHQLTKDPGMTQSHVITTLHSPKRTLTPFELTRYLDYCSEALSLLGKLAALYGQSVNEAAIIRASHDFEILTTSISRKIWQKIMILDQFHTIVQAEKPVFATGLTKTP
jgi:hypothetical protein